MLMFHKNRKQRRAKIQSKTTELNFGTLYEANKKLVEEHEPVLTKEELDNKKDIVISFLENTDNKYYMLLCNEKKDYTVFHRNNGIECLQDILIDECLPNRGNTKSIELTENNDAIEIWISIDGESYCYYFFPYDIAIIEC